MPLEITIKHDDIINLVNTLGYDAEDGGMCNGITMMAVQAFTVGQVKEFNARLKFLKKHNIPRRLTKFRRKVNKADQPAGLSRLLQRYQRLIDVMAFCDGVNLYQDPQYNIDIFGRHITQFDKDEITKLVSSAKLTAIGGLKKINAWLGVYDHHELKKYVSELNRIARKVRCSFSLVMDSSDHTMAMCYDAESRKWIVINANTLPIQQLKHEMIPEWIQKGFDKPTKTVAFATCIYVAGNQINHITKFDEEIKNSKTMIELHRVTEQKAKFSDYNDSTLVHLAAENGHAKLIVELHQAGADLNALDKNAHTPAWFAANFGHVEVIEVLQWAGAKLNLSNSVGSTPAYVAMIHGQVNILRQLAKAGIDLSQKTPRGYLLERAKERNVKESVTFLENYMRWKAIEGANNLFNSNGNARSSLFYQPEKKSCQKRHLDRVDSSKKMRV